MRNRLVIGSALILDTLLFAINIYVFFSGHSRTVLSQAVYAIADLIGSVMIYIGWIESQRPPDAKYPFGRGKERFFWAFNASLLAFVLSGMGILVTGVLQAITPEPVGDLRVALLVVGFTLILSVVGVLVVLAELRTGGTTLRTFLESPSQGLKTIFYQDIVSAAGSAVAFTGLLALDQTGNSAIDGYTAAAVGGLMILTGILLSAETRDLLIGKAVPYEQARLVLSIVERDPLVRRIRTVQSMILGPDDILLALRVNFADGLTTDEIEATINRLSAGVRHALPAIKHLVIEPAP
ncbi:MAG: cation diffusion facilitator family transporter [Thermoplasmata archaeon]|nr:cation diffusion facilitator family transporter [Thermoplasmata archaeon]